MPRPPRIDFPDALYHVTSRGSLPVSATLLQNADYVFDSDSSTATVTILDNDLPSVGIVASEPDATESGTPGQFTVTRNGPTNEPLLVNYSISNSGTAVNGVDYQTIPGNLVIPAGSTTATIPIDPLNVDATSGSKSAVLALAATNQYVVSQTASSGTVTITDDSDAPIATSAVEFCIGDGGTFEVPSGATTLYLGFHDTWMWGDNQGSVSAEVSWDVGGGSEQTYDVVATDCVDFALRQAGPPGQTEKTSIAVARLKCPCRPGRQALTFRHPARGVTTSIRTLGTGRHR